MTLREAIALAKEHKCKIKNIELRLYEQDAKSLIYWLIEDSGPSSSLFYSYTTSRGWELEMEEKQYHVHFVEDSISHTKSFNLRSERKKFITEFVKSYGSKDDEDSNWIELEFEGPITYDWKK